MTPDPTPLLGMSAPNTPLSPAPVVVVILTTAGPAFAAASITADDSSIVTGTPVPVCGEPVWVVVTVRSSTPARSSTTTVPPAARTADRSDAVTTVPTPAPPRRLGVAGCTGAL